LPLIRYASNPAPETELDADRVVADTGPDIPVVDDRVVKYPGAGVLFPITILFADPLVMHPIDKA
jgi:hypothetical protein